MAQEHSKKQAYGRITVSNFAIIAVRHLVAKANVEREREPPWTVSLLLERWLLNAFTRKDLDAIAKDSPEFKRAAEEWLRLVARNALK